MRISLAAKQRGFSPIEIVLVLAVLAVAVFLGINVLSKRDGSIDDEPVRASRSESVIEDTGFSVTSADVDEEDIQTDEDSPDARDSGVEVEAESELMTEADQTATVSDAVAEARDLETMLDQLEIDDLDTSDLEDVEAELY